ncbi:winged helix DNA-binding domain-containing protein [Tenggerimyces flavus]|uniref:Winged helix DNA-binding domain-containing protein n=1 Tax=Tenggerimyces flavus TaxID=1708749 RepID=A0ABV7YM81_9ACTN|nr:winged helix DNA-binding domain-containing protein [Tenggerimyces flavus]MBM7787320.1 hypothetical protein [Tenggerimyces flavus]
MTEVLTNRALNRATLARQFLLDKADLTALEAVRHLYGLQAQAPTPPYFALWARLRTFEPDDLSKLIVDKQVVRIVLMRGTVHLVTADDARALRPLTQPLLNRDLLQNTIHAPKLAGIDFDELDRHTRAILAERPRTNAELGAALAEHYTDRDPGSLAYAARDKVPLVQVPPRGIWGKSGQPTYATAEHWLGEPLEQDSKPEEMVRRFLAAYGPASVLDVQAWSGLTKLGEVVERIRKDLRTFRNEDGRELFDLPDAPRPDPDTPAPPNLLGGFEQLLLSYADRTRVVSVEHLKEQVRTRAVARGTVLVDGRFAGVWDLAAKAKTATLTIELWVQIEKSERDALLRRAGELLRFAEPAADTHDVRVTTR